jgi:sugar phosphate isomerase/epimerase
LADPAVRQQFLDEANKYGLEICSMAMSGFYAQSFAERPTVNQMIQDCIETCKGLGVNVAFLPLGVRGDLVKYPQLRGPIVERLKAAGQLAAQAGLIIGVETSLDAAGEAELLEQIGSPAVKIYFNVANAVKNKRDVCGELKTLGKERICQIHCTNEDGFLLQDDPQVDMPRIRQTLDELAWSGWLVLERSRSARNPRDVLANFGANARYVRSILQG